MEANFRKVKLTYIHPGTPPKGEDFHLTIHEDRLHDKILKFSKHDKNVEYHYVRTIEHKPNSIQVVVDNDQDLIIHFENHHDYENALSFLKLHRDMKTID